MMNSSVALLLVLVAVASALPQFQQFQQFQQPARAVPQIVHQSDVRDEYGQFSSGFSDTAGTTRQESGKFVPSADGKYNLVNEGGWSYIDTNGKPVKVTYVADENGFNTKSNILPVAPVA